MQNSIIKKITIAALAFLAIGLVTILISTNYPNKSEDRESKFKSGTDIISDEEYSTVTTGGEEGDSLTVLGLTNLGNKGMSDADVDIVRQYISHLMITKYDKKINDIVSISKDDIDFSVGKDAIDTTFSFRVYLDTNEYIRGELVTPLKNDTVESRKIIFYNKEGDQIQLYEI